MSVFRGKWRQFLTQNKGSIAIETAFIVPVLLIIGLISFDALGMIKSDSRAENVFYSIGDTISSVSSSSISCGTLDRIAQLSHRAYATGNWGSKGGASSGDDPFNIQGSNGLRMRIKAIEVQQSGSTGSNSNDLKAHILWSFLRAPGGFSTEWVPNTLVSVPDDYRVPGEVYIHVEGSYYKSPKLNTFSFFGNEWKTFEYYFSLRNVPTIGLVEPFNALCVGDSFVPELVF